MSQIARPILLCARKAPAGGRGHVLLIFDPAGHEAAVSSAAAYRGNAALTRRFAAFRRQLLGVRQLRLGHSYRHFRVGRTTVFGGAVKAVEGRRKPWQATAIGILWLSVP